ncbi:LTA synthase family protein [Acidomonas methanolica]|uniref:Capsule polysaccharide biosynthesis protein n=1 Tax=Acidomonas methanolica NBRC 104435 TaxID=1231351 RepID=A0A023D3A0_ACIMT|nr:LTA synthase family protein [Acidomonas methanolica]MBU2654504.1 LTA synthase family protein [Acidomonas methanolica]TCS28307.1 phosphoglycerol transferase MdoB-like AlkP superfamily enzyme [Acidomonas methanolica]GAJ28559.1 capsule polysaccharide biosynthesis protein [Acidomonas methanolica NBRC 104435]GBQ56119.1 capsule polysaccharide biosynthesis protein [Acidomonas methanolica]GEK99024.1 hypothetical protein AME01nite_15230 [Acidomonas methanolica NBRC 104435]
MNILLWSCLLLVIATELLDALAAPRRARSTSAFLLRTLPPLAVLGLIDMLCGRPFVGLGVTLALEIVLVAGSTIKLRLLDEPLVFSDLVVLVSFLREPKFYLHALSPGIRTLLLIAALTMPPLLIWSVLHGSLAVRLSGLLLCGLSLVLLRVLLKSTPLMRQPALRADFRRHGLIATLVTYRHRWKNAPPLPPPPRCMAGQPLPTLLVVQCESFCDPEALFPGASPLPGLADARRKAAQWGNLRVSGFGAYTMRSEYGVLFGLDEEQLGFRQYDPFLSGEETRLHALPNRLAAHYGERIFLHPHDLRFYGRDRLLPRWGFTRLIGGEAFETAERAGPYVADRSFGEALSRLVESTVPPRLIHGVSMENHGPWARGRLGLETPRAAYEAHLRNSDRMLATLMNDLERMEADVLLVFFGDHRPSLPGDLDPDAGRETPYLIIRYVHGRPTDLTPAEHKITDITPAGLNAAILAALGIRQGQAEAMPEQAPIRRTP